MTDATVRTRLADLNFIALMELSLFGLIIAALALKLRLIFVLNINWDEFFFLSKVYDLQRGVLDQPFQTFHVHLFGWLPSVSANEVDQIIAGRGAMFLAGLGTCVFIYLLGRLFFDRLAALFPVLCYLALSSVIEHGASFRADPLCLFLLTGSLYGLLRRPRGALGAVLAGGGVALALMVTIKSSLYLPVIGAVFLCLALSSEAKAPVLRNLLAFAAALFAVYATLTFFHASTLASAEHPGADAVLGRVASKVILIDQFFPRWRYFVLDLLDNFWIWGLVAAGLGLTCHGLWRAKDRRRAGDWLLLTFLIPLGSPVFYRNAFPYFYVLIMVPAIVLCGVWLERIVLGARREGSRRRLALIPCLVLPVVVGFIGHYADNAEDATASQSELIGLVHRLFPQPTAYIDRCSMISSYLKSGFFMSSWGMETYLDRARPIMRDILVTERPAFLIANTRSLDLSLPWQETAVAGGATLLEEDFEVLKRNFVRHWGALYVAGKRFAFETAARDREFEILIPGTYTVEAETDVVIDGLRHRPGSVIELSAATHRAAPTAAPAGVTLRWGDHLARPPHRPSERPIFFGLTGR